MSLRSSVFNYCNTNTHPSVSDVYQAFPLGSKSTVEQYYYQWKKKNNPNINTLLINIDTIKEMEISIQQIKDPVKRCENIARLHSMKLKPLVNKSEKSLKEMLDAS